MPPPFSAPRKLRRLLVFSVTGRSLSKRPLKLLKSMLPFALAGRRRRTSPLKVLTSRSLPSPKSFDSIVTSELKPSMFWLRVDADHRDRRAERLDVEPRPRRHLDVEVGFDDVVVAAFDEAMVGVDFDGVAALRDLELDVVEPLARRAADGVHDQLVAGAAGDLDAAGEGLQPQRAARRHRQRAVDGFGLARSARAVVVRSRWAQRPGAASTRAKRRAKAVVTGRVMVFTSIVR